MTPADYRIDLYYAHFDDGQTPLEQSLRGFDALVKAGTVRHIGASNYTHERLTAARELQREEGLAEFTVLQRHTTSSSAPSSARSCPSRTPGTSPWCSTSGWPRAS